MPPFDHSSGVLFIVTNFVLLFRECHKTFFFECCLLCCGNSFTPKSDVPNTDLLPEIKSNSIAETVEEEFDAELHWEVFDNGEQLIFLKTASEKEISVIAPEDDQRSHE